MTTGTLSAEASAKPARIGSFIISERLETPGAPSGQILLRVLGDDSSTHVGRTALATCFASPKDDASANRTRELVDALAALSHPALAPVLESGMTGSIVFWIREQTGGQRLREAQARNPLPTAAVSKIVTAVAEGLQTAHEAGMSHGSISADVIYVQPDGSAILDGLGIQGRGPAVDQLDLGTLAIRLLGGKPWIEPEFAEHSDVTQRIVRAQKVREWLAESTERIATVLSRATEPEPVNRYPSIAEFARDFGEQVSFSAQDLIHAAYESISAKNPELASLLADKARLYDPTSDALTVLNLQLHGGSLFDHGQVTVPDRTDLPDAPFPVFEITDMGVDGPLTVPPMIPLPANAKPMLRPELTAGLPAEFLESIAHQFEPMPPKKRMNPMFILILGGLGMVILLLIAVLVTLVVPNNG